MGLPERSQPRRRILGFGASHPSEGEPGIPVGRSGTPQGQAFSSTLQDQPKFMPYPNLKSNLENVDTDVQKRRGERVEDP